MNFTAKITEKLSIDDRLQRMEELEAYITVKNHKDHFPNKVPCQLITRQNLIYEKPIKSFSIN